MADTDDPGARLQEAARRRREAQHLRERLAAAVAHGEATMQRVQATRARLVDETADVERLEGFSWQRVAAGLTGSRGAHLERERAEQAAAQYAVAVAEEQHRTAQADLAGVRAELSGFGDAEAELAAALDAQERWLSTRDPSVAQQLAALATRRGEALAEIEQTDQAGAAGMAAADLLGAAAQLLGEARGWSTWDTFGGGGLLTDMAKYDRLDRVSHVLRQADGALDAFSRELGDVGVGPVGGVGVGELGRVFDVFFDNLFSDLAVRDRIRDAEERVDRSRRHVAQVLQQLGVRRHGLGQEVAELDRRREAVLLP